MLNRPTSNDEARSAELAATLAPQYQLVRLIGRGGMGAVYLAYDPFLDRHVAIKTLPAELASGEARERFLREARTAARLSHAHIVPLYSFGQAGELLYYIMGYVEGESLEARLQRDKRLPPDDARRIIGELADALSYAHQMGIVHRDLKPDNILLDATTGRALLTDFGIAKQRATAETLTGTGVVVGTPHYMSPEQAAGERQLDGRSDIYSLGVVAYRMITGRRPFEGERLMEVIAGHVSRSPVPVGQLAPDTPLDLANVVARALEKNPADRWPAAETMRDALVPGSDEALPDDLRRAQHVGLRMGALIAAFFESAYAAWVIWLPKMPDGRHMVHDAAIWALLFSSIGVAIGGTSLLGSIGLFRRYGWRPVLEAWFRQPGWIKSWWPRLGRLNPDLWDRLPPYVKLFRRANGLTIPLSVAVVDLFFWIMRNAPLMTTSHASVTSRLFWFVGIGYALILGGAIYSGVVYRRWMKAVGLSKRDAGRMLSESLGAKAFWAQPHIAAVLSPPTERRVAQDQPAETVRAIEAVVRDAPTGGEGDLYREAGDAARGLARNIAGCDQEIAQLVRDADPRERKRVQASLDGLGAGSEGEREPKRQMRQLLEQQAKLFDDLARRRADAEARRAFLMEQLRTLSIQLSTLRAMAAADGKDPAEITGRIASIIRGVEYRVDAMRDTNQVTNRT